jgi:hypothetical protein
MGWLERALACSPQRKGTAAFIGNVIRFKSERTGQVRNRRRHRFATYCKQKKKKKRERKKK